MAEAIFDPTRVFHQSGVFPFLPRPSMRESKGTCTSGLMELSALERCASLTLTGPPSRERPRWPQLIPVALSVRLRPPFLMTATAGYRGAGLCDATQSDGALSVGETIWFGSTAGALSDTNTADCQIYGLKVDVYIRSRKRYEFLG